MSLLASCLDVPVEPGAGTYVGMTQKICGPQLMFERNLWRGAVVIRDPRDAIVSLYHYMKGDYYKRVFGPHHIFDSIESMYTQYFRPYFMWSLGAGFSDLPHSFIRWGWPVVRYEDLWNAPEREMQRLFLRWGLDISSDKIASAVKANSLDSMRSGSGNVRSVVDKSVHFRKGGCGGFIDELPESVLADFERRYFNDLVNWGYQPVTMDDPRAPVRKPLSKDHDHGAY